MPVSVKYANQLSQDERLDSTVRGTCALIPIHTRIRGRALEIRRQSNSAVVEATTSEAKAESESRGSEAKAKAESFAFEAEAETEATVSEAEAGYYVQTL